MITQTNQQLNNCGDFSDAGLCLIPLRLDGSKAPAIPSWKEYQERKSTSFEIDKWFSQPAGAAIVCGAVSGGLEVLDFDHNAETVFPVWSKMVDPILVQLPVVETPSGGFHVYYLCHEVTGNARIACNRDSQVLIESRGEGGYITTVVSPPEVHAEHFEYIQVAGPVLPEIPTISTVDRKTLWKAAATFDRSGIREKAVEKLHRQLRPRQPQRPCGEKTPWDDFNARGSWIELLTRHNWTSPNGIYWRHPNASTNHSHSAAIRKAKNGQEVLVVFSTSSPLEPNKSHSLFSAFKTLDHNDNAAEAARELSRQRYGQSS